MTPARLVAIGFIYCCAAIAWFTLGASVVERTGERDASLAQEVSQLWGGRHNQVAPDAWYSLPRLVTEEVQEKDEKGRTVTKQVTRESFDSVPLALVSSRIEVALELEQRKQGLLWYDTYGVAFSGEYRVRNVSSKPQLIHVHFSFPSTEGIYDGFRLSVDGVQAAPASDLAQGLNVSALVAGSAEAVAKVSYRSRGLGEWTYAFTKAGVGQVSDFHLAMTTNFAGIDFPAGTLSPTTRTPQGEGYRLAWDFESLVTGQKVGMDPPSRLNPGPLAARITFFAPVSLLFFFTVMVILGVLRRQSLHPMNYFFLSAAFFAFHLLLAYLVDHISVHAAFLLASATSVFLVVSYLRLVCGLRSALAEAGLAQLVYLVLFSYAFFFEGVTGLTVTLGAVVTLYVLMQATAHVDWTAAFAKNEEPKGPAQRPAL